MLLLVGSAVCNVPRQEHGGEPLPQLSTTIDAVDRCLETFLRLRQSNNCNPKELSQVMAVIRQLLAVRAHLTFEVQNDKECMKCHVATNIRILIGTTTEWIGQFSDGCIYDRVLARSPWGTLIDDAEEIDQLVGLVSRPYALDGNGAQGRVVI